MSLRWPVTSKSAGSVAAIDLTKTQDEHTRDHRDHRGRWCSRHEIEGWNAECWLPVAAAQKLHLLTKLILCNISYNLFSVSCTQEFVEKKRQAFWGVIFLKFFFRLAIFKSWKLIF